ncbi:PREDICTED: protein EVI2A [Thamnophis sirtalis]|uniref:Protein EVI2A n=1 Tax=Thamnophis sirtalis TaxID=35019 RepID=A0A6I9XP40_9SAUR|nr:PREDICTED: protein EVI2A [Thamnophis sirtalis]
MRLFDHMGLGFLLGIILPSCSQVRVMADLTTIVYPSVPTSQTPTSNSSLTTLDSRETATYTTQISTSESTASVRSERLTETPTSTALEFSSTLPTEGLPSSTDSELSTLGVDPTKTKPCEENYKQQMLICLIIIGVLIFICVVLLLVIVVLAGKLTYDKRKQLNKRFPRSNGDFLSTNSLWPIGLETLQRVSTESPKPRGLSLERPVEGQGQNGDDVNKKLVSELADRQKQKEISANTHKTIITTVEI